MTPWFEARADGILLRVLVQPRASRSEVAGLHGEFLKVRLAAPPVDGAANDALVRLIAERLGVRRTDVEVVSGSSSRRKVVRVGAPVDASRLLDA